MLTELRPSTVSEFIDWLRNAIRQLEEIANAECDLSNYDYSAHFVAEAERHARFIGAQVLCERCKVSFRLNPNDGSLLSPKEGLTILGECLAWCVEREPMLGVIQSDSSNASDRPHIFPNGRHFLYEDEATEYLGVKQTTLRDARLAGKLSSSGKAGRRPTYTMADFIKWQECTTPRKDN